MALPLGSGEAEIRAQLETHGVAQVRILLGNSGLPTVFHPVALRWLAEKDQETEERSTASQKDRAAIDARIVAAAERQSAAAESQANEARLANSNALRAIYIGIILAIANATLTIVLFSINH